jgi:hypothetical protein
MAKLWLLTSIIARRHSLHCSSSTRFAPVDSAPLLLSIKMYRMAATGKTGSRMVYLMLSLILSDRTAAVSIVRSRIVLQLCRWVPGTGSGRAGDLLEGLQMACSGRGLLSPLSHTSLLNRKESTEWRCGIWPRLLKRVRSIGIERLRGGCVPYLVCSISGMTPRNGVELVPPRQKRMQTRECSSRPGRVCRIATGEMDKSFSASIPIIFRLLVCVFILA